MNRYSKHIYTQDSVNTVHFSVYNKYELCRNNTLRDNFNRPITATYLVFSQ